MSAVRRTALLAVGVALVLAGCSSGSTPTTTSRSTSKTTAHASSTIAMRGTLQFLAIYPGMSMIGTDSCTGMNGYNDITEGAEVVVSDDSGATLAITNLGPGVPGKAFIFEGCKFAFTASVPSGHRFYGITVSHRGTVKFTEQQMTVGPALHLGETPISSP